MKNNKTIAPIAYAIDDLPQLLGLSRSKLYEEVRDGRLRAVKAGARTLVTRAAVDEFLAQLPRLEPRAAIAAGDMDAVINANFANPKQTDAKVHSVSNVEKPKGKN
jgi:excisionase family DNA binding protein